MEYLINKGQNIKNNLSLDNKRKLRLVIVYSVLGGVIMLLLLTDWHICKNDMFDDEMVNYSPRVADSIAYIASQEIQQRR